MACEIPVLCTLGSELGPANKGDKRTISKSKEECVITNNIFSFPRGKVYRK